MLEEVNDRDFFSKNKIKKNSGVDIFFCVNSFYDYNSVDMSDGNYEKILIFKLVRVGG